MGDRADLRADLRCQLARRCEHQRRLLGAVGVEPIDKRDAEGERLARSGRRLREDVAAGEHVGDDEPLDGERLADAAVRQGVDHRRGHAEIGEGLRGHWSAPCRRPSGPPFAIREIRLTRIAQALKTKNLAGTMLPLTSTLAAGCTSTRARGWPSTASLAREQRAEVRRLGRRKLSSDAPDHRDRHPRPPRRPRAPHEGRDVAGVGRTQPSTRARMSSCEAGRRAGIPTAREAGLRRRARSVRAVQRAAGWRRGLDSG